MRALTHTVCLNCSFPELGSAFFPSLDYEKFLNIHEIDLYKELPCTVISFWTGSNFYGLTMPGEDKASYHCPG